MSLAENLAHIVLAIKALLGAWASWTPPAPHIVTLGDKTYAAPWRERQDDNPHLPLPSQAIRTLLRDRAQRALNRLMALFTQWQQGTLPRPVHDFPRPKPAPRPNTRKPSPSLPRRPNWAGAKLLELRQRGEQLQNLIARPDFQPFLQACPQAGRLLRPLCRAIGAQLPPALQLPQLPPKPRPKRVRPARERPARLTDPALNLPRRVIRASLYFRKKFGPGG